MSTPIGSLACKAQRILDATRAVDFLGPLALRIYLFFPLWMAGNKKFDNWDSTVAWFGNPDWGLGMPLPAVMVALGQHRSGGRRAVTDRSRCALGEYPANVHHGGRRPDRALAAWLGSDCRYAASRRTVGGRQSVVANPWSLWLADRNRRFCHSQQRHRIRRHLLHHATGIVFYRRRALVVR